MAGRLCTLLGKRGQPERKGEFEQLKQDRHIVC